MIIIIIIIRHDKCIIIHPKGKSDNESQDTTALTAASH